MRPLLVAVSFTVGLSAQNVVQLGTGIFRGQTVTYEIVDGRAMYQGDIDLGPAEELEAPVSKGSAERGSIALTSTQFRWPGGAIPYVIDAAIPNQQRILDAVAAWNAMTPIKLAPRAAEANYVHLIQFNSNGRCSSTLGMAGGEQLLRVDDTCSANTLIHEIGHAVGLQHEQARADRDFYVTQNLANVDKRYYSDHNMQVTFSTELGGYDYGSIMHYTRYEEGRRVQLPVYETIPPGMPLDGAAHGLSAGDIDAVMRLYGITPAQTTISTNPAGLQVIVDGVTITTPQAFDWAPGSQHSLDVPDRQLDGSPARYLFGRWNDNGPQAHTIVASPDLTVYQVSFVRQYKVITGVTPAAAGIVTVTPASPDGYYTEGVQISVAETPAAGFIFSGWNGPGSFIYVNVHGWAEPAVSFRVTMPNAAYVAHYFQQSSLPVFTTDPPGVPITVNGMRGATPRTVVTPGASVPVSADATVVIGGGSDRYVFVGWSDGGAAAHTVTLPSTGVMPVITAIYKLQHNFTVAITGLGAVAVIPPSPDGYYDDGTILLMAAAPAAGWQFTGWGRDLSGANPTQTVTVNEETYVTAGFQRPFVVTPAGIVNGASFLGGTVSPGEIVTIFGYQIGPPDLITAALDSSGKVSTTLAGTRVLFDNLGAPLIYVSPNQIAAIVPYGVAGKSTTSVQVSLNGRATAAVSVPVVTAAPGVFTSNSSGRGLGAILNQDGSVNSSANPALKGSVVVLFVTGEGQTNPGGVDGAIAGATLPVPQAQPVTVLIGGPKGVGKNAQIPYAGAAPGLVAGVMQINVVIPPDAPSGNVPVSFQVGGASSVDMTSVAIQ